ncbi:hypothetical protein NDU88_001629 [Pleurodeles waltl]|uniref:Uncharacterized protein n=1 Tax=Pleurodeles waltl TaxID=8319 RepID=A0AAV7TIA3_PLEWA|nr:hypothetical protein NDU88_001629 [Pleurodeles waltl]
MVSAPHPLRSRWRMCGAEALLAGTTTFPQYQAGDNASGLGGSQPGGGVPVASTPAQRTEQNRDRVMSSCRELTPGLACQDSLVTRHFTTCSSQAGQKKEENNGDTDWSRRCNNIVTRRAG